MECLCVNVYLDHYIRLSLVLKKKITLYLALWLGQGLQMWMKMDNSQEVSKRTVVYNYVPTLTRALSCNNAINLLLSSNPHCPSFRFQFNFNKKIHLPHK